MKVLVCGGRDYSDMTRIVEILDNIDVTMLIHGGAQGADSLAGTYAKSRGIPAKAYRADWNLHGKAAGVIRNQEMLDQESPEMVVAFPGGRGTADMVRRAKKAGVLVRMVEP